RVPRQQRGLRDPLPLDDRDEPHGHLGGRQRVPARGAGYLERQPPVLHRQAAHSGHRRPGAALREPPSGPPEPAV
ncbi:MAG: LSU ribosomal protein L31p @ LSU ribosomal protein L31p, zinc-independent, partial [uncultured Rubrobacteraceae bacterium]